MALFLRAGTMVRKLPANCAVKIGSNAISSTWKSQSACLSSGRGGKKVDPNGKYWAACIAWRDTNCETGKLNDTKSTCFHEF